jgi:hypothetical protein
MFPGQHRDGIWDDFLSVQHRVVGQHGPRRCICWPVIVTMDGSLGELEGGDNGKVPSRLARPTTIESMRAKVTNNPKTRSNKRPRLPGREIRYWRILSRTSLASRQMQKGSGQEDDGQGTKISATILPPEALDTKVTGVALLVTSQENLEQESREITARRRTLGNLRPLRVPVAPRWRILIRRVRCLR